MSTPLFRRLRDDGVPATLAWAASWLYWRTPVHRLGLHQRRTSSPAASVATAAPLTICHDLKQWSAGRAGAGYVSVEPARRLTRRPPQTLETAGPGDIAAYLEVDAPERGLAWVPGATLLNANGLLRLPDGQLVGETVALTPAGQTQVLTAEVAAQPPLTRPARRLRGRFFSALLIGGTNYYHWLHDVILKIQRVQPHLPPDTQFIVPAALKPFQRATLALLGLTEKRLRYYGGHTPWTLETLYVAVPYPKPLLETAPPLEWLRDQSRAAFGATPPAQPHRRLFLSRVADGHYCAVNEAELVAGLADLNFEVCRPWELTLAEQVALFAQAEVIVGTGTGLCNMVFASPGAKIVQWQDPTHFVYALWTLSEALGHHYHYFYADPIANPHSPLNNFHVPLPKLRATLAALL